MARRKKTTTRRRRASFAPIKRRRSSSKGAGVKMIQFDSMIYGALRGYTSNMLAPITAKIPLGSIADEVVMGGVNYLIAKNTKGMLKDIAMKGLVIENARLGEAIVTGGIGSFMPVKKSASPELAYDY